MRKLQCPYTTTGPAPARQAGQSSHECHICAGRLAIASRRRRCHDSAVTQPIHIVAGATASGKSARALALARERDGVIINADATQLYAELRILSARPSDAELAQAPHALYGILQGGDPASVARWLALAKPEIEAAWAAGRLPVVCGGTGLYLKALLEGLSPIPDIAESHRAEAVQLLQDLGNAAFHAKLAEVDPVIAARLAPGNTQRLIRAWEVWRATGKPLSAWQAEPKQPPFPGAAFTVEVIDLPRAEIYRRCDARFARMMQQGALEEVKALQARNYPADAPVMKAVGVPELLGYLHGEYPLEEAVRLARHNTRRYAKRQLTWLRHQL